MKKLRLATIGMIVVGLFTATGYAARSFGLISPGSSWSAFEYFSYLLVAAELLLLVLGLWNLRRILRALQSIRAAGVEYGFLNQFYRACDIKPGGLLAGFVFAEAAVLFYACVAPFRKNEVPADGQPVFMHTRGGYKTGFIAIMCVGLLELIGMHLLLTYFFGDLAAWIVSGLSAYGMLYLIADFSALIKRPAMIRGGLLYLYIGIRWAGQYALSNIVRVEPVDYRSDTTGALDLSLMSSANLRIDFQAEQSIRGLLGIRKKFTALLLTADEPDRVRALLPGDSGRSHDL